MILPDQMITTNTRIGNGESAKSNVSAGLLTNGDKSDTGAPQAIRIVNIWTVKTIDRGKMVCKCALFFENLGGC